MKEIGNMQGPAFRCRYRRIVVLAGVVLAGFYCSNIIMTSTLLLGGQHQMGVLGQSPLYIHRVPGAHIKTFAQGLKAKKTIRIRLWSWLRLLVQLVRCRLDGGILQG